MADTNFSNLQLRPQLLSNLATLGYKQMTPIQAQALPLILRGIDVIGQAKTGSGKTAAFGLGLLQNLDVKRFRVQTLVLCPTRELADQVAQEVRKLARAEHNVKVLTLCGGAPFGPQLGSLAHGAHVIVGTPGRVEEHLRKGSLQLADVNTFVLDEADRMLDMGFQEALDTIMGYLPDRRQNLLFSATYTEQVKKIAEQWMQAPVMVKVESTHDQISIKQQFFRIGSKAESRMIALRIVLLSLRPDAALIFCNTKKDTQEVADYLSQQDFTANALHGDLDQKERDRTLVLFANKSTSILVATDVAARGLDIDGVDLVVNFQLAKENEVHLHRVGRTGRAGSKGQAITLVSEKESYKLERLETFLKHTFPLQALPPADVLKQPGYKAPMVTIQIDGGKRQKLRPGDILGALTKDGGMPGEVIGKITITDNSAYVAIKRKEAHNALSVIQNGTLKAKRFRARLLNN